MPVGATLLELVPDDASVRVGGTPVARPTREPASTDARYTTRQ